MGYESSAERWSPVQSVEKILLSVVSMLAGNAPWRSGPPRARGATAAALPAVVLLHHCFCSFLFGLDVLFPAFPFNVICGHFSKSRVTFHNQEFGYDLVLHAVLVTRVNRALSPSSGPARGPAVSQTLDTCTGACSSV